MPSEKGLTLADARDAAARVTIPATASATHREKNIPFGILHEAPARRPSAQRDFRRIFDARQSLRRCEARIRSKNRNRFKKLR